MMIVTCIKQHLSNIWSPIHEKVKQRWGWVEKSVAYKKKKACSTKQKVLFSLVNRVLTRALLGPVNGPFPIEFTKAYT